MFAVAVLLFLTPAADAKEKELSADAQKDLKKLEGKWKAVKGIKDGVEEKEAPESADLILEFKGRSVSLKGEEVLTVAALDTSTDPKCIDFKAVVDRGGLKKGMVFEGIYKVDGDTLVLALIEDGGANRPGEFKSAKGSKVVLITFERVK